MDNDKPMATAIIKFYANKHVDVELDTIRNITPRTLSIAGHMLQKKYSGMKGEFIRDEHRRIREQKAAEEAKSIEDEAKFHEEEDARLQKASVKDAKKGDKLNKALADAESKANDD